MAGVSCFHIYAFKKKAFVLLGLFFIMTLAVVYPQNKNIADSLESIYSKGLYDQKDKLKILRALAKDHPNTE
jgi:hypothetical protein